MGNFRSRFRGALLRPGEEGYEETRRVWNGAIDRHPAIIARCVGTDDVAEAVRFARDQDLLVSVRGGGHSVAGHAVCDGGLMIDLSLMRGVRVDPAAGMARADGGCVVSDLDRATQRYGLATTGGVVSHTGIGGLTLGGGLGHLMRSAGLTVDNLQSVDLVTDEGQNLRVDPDTDPDLFWGLRGGGGNFGIATSFEYRLHRVGPLVLGGPIFWPLEQARDVFGFVSEFAPGMPDELGLALTARLAPPAPFLPPDQYGRPVIGLLPVWSGNLHDGERALAPLRMLGEPIADAVRPVPYLFVQTMLDSGNPHGLHYYWRSQRLVNLSVDVVDVILGLTEGIRSPLSYVAGFAVGGAVCRVADADSAVGRQISFDINIVAAWPPSDPASDEHIAWVRGGSKALRAHSAGVFSHFLSDEGAAGIRDAYGERLARLTKLKNRCDPTNFFSMNANIPLSNREPERSEQV